MLSLEYYPTQHWRTTRTYRHSDQSCNCSKEKFAKGILSLGSDEIKSIIDENHEAQTTCHFCGSKYHFTEDELITLYEEAKKAGK